MELPLLLAGPILRRVETTLATVWIALYGRFALQVTDSPDQEGLGTHHMGGAAWGAHKLTRRGQKTESHSLVGPRRDRAAGNDHPAARAA